MKMYSNMRDARLESRFMAGRLPQTESQSAEPWPTLNSSRAPFVSRGPGTWLGEHTRAETLDEQQRREVAQKAAIMQWEGEGGHMDPPKAIRDTKWFRRVEAHR
jgi:hypothetical protein